MLTMKLALSLSHSSWRLILNKRKKMCAFLQKSSNIGYSFGFVAMNNQIIKQWMATNSYKIKYSKQT